MSVLFPLRFGDVPSSGGFRSVFMRQIGGLGAPSTTSTDTNSGVQRLRAYRDGQDSYYRGVARKEALQVQQIKLNELLAQRQEIEAERLRQEALRDAGAAQRLEAKHSGTLAPNPALEDRIAALVRDLADINGALVLTRAEIAQLDAIESWQALLDEDEAIIILAASM